MVMGALSPRTRNAQSRSSEWRCRLSSRPTCDRDGAQSRHHACCLLGARRSTAPASASGAERVLPRSPGGRGDSPPMASFGVTGEAPPRSRYRRGDRVAFVRAAASPAMAQSPAGFRLGRGVDCELEAPSGHADLQRAREADDRDAARVVGDARHARASEGAAECGCSGTSVRVPDFRKVSPAEHASLCLRLHLQFLRGGGGIPTDWLSADPPHRPQRRRYRRAVQAARLYSHGPMSRSARAGLTTPTIGATRPCGRRPPVGCAACAADPEICRPANQRADAAVEAEGGLVATVTENGEVTIDDQFIGRLEGSALS